MRQARPDVKPHAIKAFQIKMAGKGVGLEKENRVKKGQKKKRKKRKRGKTGRKNMEEMGMLATYEPRLGK